MFRNWKAICQEPDQVLRLLLATATDVRVLEGLEKGFPAFFAAEEQVLRVPLSAIQGWRSNEKKNSGLTFPADALDHFGIPHFDFNQEVGDVYPEGLMETIGDKNITINGKAGSGVYEELYFELHGKRCLIAEYAPDSLVILVPPEFIDLSA